MSRCLRASNGRRCLHSKRCAAVLALARACSVSFVSRHDVCLALSCRRRCHVQLSCKVSCGSRWRSSAQPQASEPDLVIAVPVVVLVWVAPELPWPTCNVGFFLCFFFWMRLRKWVLMVIRVSAVDWYSTGWQRQQMKGASYSCGMGRSAHCIPICARSARCIACVCRPCTSACSVLIRI